MKQLFFFEQMLTPKIITFVYWLMLAGSVFGGLGSMFLGRFSFGGFLAGLFGMLVGALSARIFCELMIVLFKMNESLQALRNK